MAAQSLEQAWQSLTDGAAFLTQTVAGRWLLFFALVVLTWGIARAISWLVLRRFTDLRHVEKAAAVLINRLFVFLAVVIAIVAYSAAIFGIDVAAAAATLGLLSLAVGFGLQNTVANIAGGIALAMDRPFRIGDQIEVGEHLGEVEEIGIRSTRIVTLRKEYIVIPNKYLEEQPIINYTMVYPELRLDLKVPVSYDSDRRLAEKIMLDVARAHPIILKKPAPRVLLREFTQSGLELELRCWLSLPRSRFIVSSDLLKAIKDRFEAEGVEIALMYQVNVDKEALPNPRRLPPAKVVQAQKPRPQPRVLLVLTAKPIQHQLASALRLMTELDALIIGLFATARKGREAADEASQALMDVETLAERDDRWFKPIFRLAERPEEAVRDVAVEEDVDLVLVLGHRGRFGLDWPLRGPSATAAGRLAKDLDTPLYEAPDRPSDVDAMLERVRADVEAYQQRRRPQRHAGIEVSPPEPSRVVREGEPAAPDEAEQDAADTKVT